MLKDQDFHIPPLLHLQSHFQFHLILLSQSPNSILLRPNPNLFRYGGKRWQNEGFVAISGSGNGSLLSKIGEEASHHRRTYGRQLSHLLEASFSRFHSPYHWWSLVQSSSHFQGSSINFLFFSLWLWSLGFSMLLFLLIFSIQPPKSWVLNLFKLIVWVNLFVVMISIVFYHVGVGNLGII